jgi:predicted Ser/Thr protein kinase
VGKEGKVRDTAVAILHDPLIPVTSLRPDLPESHNLLFAKLLARDPAQRFPNGAELAKQVRETARGRWYIGQLSSLLEQSPTPAGESATATRPTTNPAETTQLTDVTVAAFTPTLFAPDVLTPVNPHETEERKFVPQDTLPAGTRIGRYEISSMLGFGGMATVYLAQDPDVQRAVALKLLPLKFTFAPQFRQLFAHEAKLVAGLRHEAIVPVFDFGEHNDQPYLVMQYLAGGTLNERLPENQPLPLKRVVALMDRLAAALAAAHAKGIVHRDIKPGNVIFNGEDEAFLSDFGIAVLTEVGAAEDKKEQYAGGTPKYMSPEQATAVLAGKTVQVDHRSDIYSLGVLLFQCLTGRVPFDNRSPIEQMQAHINEPVPNMRELNPALSSRLQPIVAKAMAKAPGERYDTAVALAEALRQASSGRWYLAEL